MLQRRMFLSLILLLTFFHLSIIFPPMDALISNLRSASRFNAFTPSTVSLPWSVVLESRLIYACTGIYQASLIF